MTVVERIFETRSRDDFSANDITVVVIDIFEELFEISPSAVKTEVYIRQEDVRGRADIVVQDGIGIETKSNLKDEHDKAETQISNILTKLEAEGHRTPIGIATDGIDWDFFLRIKETPYRYYSFSVDESTEVEDLEEELWKALTPLRKEEFRPDPTAEKVAEVLRPNGPAYNEITSQIRGEMNDVLENDRVEFTSKFAPWFEVFSYVYNDFHGKCKKLAIGSDVDGSLVDDLKSNDRFSGVDSDIIEGAVELYIRHTYLASLAKSLSALVALGDDAVTEAQLNDPEGLLTGAIVRDSGVQISDPNDYFTWIGKGDNPDRVVNSILQVLRRFSTNYTDDIFRHLYEQVVDEDTRHELGEFFTPKWMAELMVNDNIENYQDEVIDPACGSGTFLVFSLKQKLDLRGEDSGEISRSQVADIFDQVWGIDVNPLSGLLARTNLYLTLTTHVEPSKIPRDISPNVITADTFIFPRYNESQRQLSESETEDQPLIPVQITDEIHVPVKPDLNVKQAQNIITGVGSLLEKGEDKIPSEDKLSGEVGEYQEAIFSTMRDLRKKYGDNLWKFVLRNYGVPPLLSQQFDLVIGNPPWLSYREARGDIKETMDKIATDYDIKSPVQGKTSFNLSVPFFLASSNLLDDGGRISFVLPLSVLDGISHAPFLEMLLERDDVEVTKLYDLEEVNPTPFPHTLPSSIVSAKVESGGGI